MAYKGDHRTERKRSPGLTAGSGVTAERHWRLVGEDFKKSASQQAESRAKLAHDIHTQLYIIIGFAELMLEEIPGKINDEQRLSLNDVLKSGKRLLALLDDFVITSGSGSGVASDGQLPGGVR